MLSNGIETRPFFWPLHLQMHYLKNIEKDESLPNSEKIGKNGLYIPIGPHINRKKQKFIVTSLIKNINSLLIFYNIICLFDRLETMKSG